VRRPRLRGHRPGAGARAGAARRARLVRPQHHADPAGRGSYFFLGVVLLDVELEYDEPFERDHCGTCTSCVDACPTGALLGRDETGAPVMDARRCISYLTIELKGPDPARAAAADRQPDLRLRHLPGGVPAQQPEVRADHQRGGVLAAEGVHGAELIELMGMDQAEFSRRFKGSPVKRAKRRGLLRNVAVALGNWGSPEAVPVLARRWRTRSR
jgi:epoxyqueuosine reductase